jgi:rhamnose transport system permease protein
MGQVHLLFRFREIGVLVFLVLVIAVSGMIAPRFLLPSNLRNILLDIPLLLVVAMGMTMVIISRHIDLSVGAILGVSGISVGLLFKAYPGMPILLGLALGALIGLLLGAINGGLVTILRVPAIIATLGTLSIYRGLVFTISQGKQVDPNDIPAALIRLSQTSPIGIPWLALLAFAIAALTHSFLSTHHVGRSLYAIGGNPEAARLAGIPVQRRLWFTFLITGGLSGLAGVMYASRLGVVNPAQVGTGFELSVIAATVIGGTQVFGGVGSAMGTLLGCLLLTVINNALTVTGLSAFWQRATYGAIILVALVTDSLLRQRMEGTAAGRDAA